MGADEVPTFCPLCVSRCGARAVVEDGVFLELVPDPSHPTGSALCLKGKAAPGIVSHRSRLLHPMKRTTPKDAADPGWQRIGWDEALDTITLDPTHKHAFTRESFRHLLEAIGGWQIERLEVCRPNWSFICVARKEKGK